MTANRFDVMVGGRNHTVTIDRGENGKDIVRVDGRAAGRPFGTDEAVRIVSVAGFQYSVERTGANEFSVEPATIMPEVAAAGLVHDDPTRKVWLVWSLLAAGILAFLVIMVVTHGLFRDPASKRVELLLTDMKGGQDKETERSRYMWARGSRLDSIELSWADTGFMRWRQEKGFLNGFSSFKVTGSENVKGAEVPTSIVTFVADGREFKVRVPERRPMSWAE
jgi:hypothetical protein